MRTNDELVGEVVRRARGERAQAEVAQAMVDAGHPKWSQSTVWAVEKGTRPLRLVEAVSLAEILGLRLWNLTGDPKMVKPLNILQELAVQHYRLMKAALEIDELQQEFHIALMQAGLKLGDPGVELSREDRARVTQDPRDLVHDGRLEDGGQAGLYFHSPSRTMQVEKVGDHGQHQEA